MGGGRKLIQEQIESDVSSTLRFLQGPLSPTSALLWCLAFGLWAQGCTKDLQLIQDPPDAVAATTTGPWASMIYVARTDSGLIAIDLGWTGVEEVLPTSLAQLGASASDVRFVFLTHAHRDHIAAWPLVRQARFGIAAAEVPGLTGEQGYSGWATQMGDELNEYPRPRPGELALTHLQLGHGVRAWPRHRFRLPDSGPHTGQYGLPVPRHPVRRRRDQLAPRFRLSGCAAGVFGQRRRKPRKPACTVATPVARSGAAHVQRTREVRCRRLVAQGARTALGVHRLEPAHDYPTGDARVLQLHHHDMRPATRRSRHRYLDGDAVGQVAEGRCAT